MPEIPFLLQLFFIGFIASFIGSIVSGTTSFISLASMLFIGAPPFLAVSTYEVGSLGSRLGAFYVYFKAKKIVWRLVLPLSVLGFLGATIGAKIFVSIDEEVLSKIIGYLLLATLPLLLVKKNLGVQNHTPSIPRTRVGYISYFLVSIWAGFLASGVGVIFLYIYLIFFGLTILETKGTDRIPGFVSDIGAIIIFFLHSIINWLYVLAFLPGMLLGSLLGSKLAIQIGDKWLRMIILATVAFMSLKLIFY